MKLIVRVSDSHIVNLLSYSHLRALTVERVTGIFATPAGLEPGVQDMLLFVCADDVTGPQTIGHIFSILANPCIPLADLCDYSRPAGPGEVSLLLHAANAPASPAPPAERFADPQPYESET